MPPETFAPALALAMMLLVGLSLGLLGSGGSIITLPVLVYVAGIPVAQAVTMSLVLVGVTAAFGAWILGHQRGVHLQAAAVFAVTGVVGAYFGAQITHLVSEATLLALFGALMLTVGGRLLMGRADAAPGADSCRLRRCIAAGLVVGVLTGFLGVGGGFLIVPALLLFAGTDMRQAVPTSLTVIAANAAGGIVGHLGQTGVPVAETGVFLLVALAGMLAGSALSNRLSASVLQRAFAWAILLMGSAIVVRNLWLIASRSL
ncbi:MAG: sulfite exporter TauE/SafE family protein [Vicinamibacterales bacterium]|nr:sulfite exporter TauE/SafE family protein [Vicinamibacterales bacterium]